MKLLRGLKPAQALPPGVAATIGNFDGVHLGHQALLARLSAQAQQRHLPVVVVLFEPQPSEYFLAERAPIRLMRLREKLQVLSTLGVDYVCCLPFNDALATLSAEDFANQVIFNTLGIKYLLVGDDFRFGFKRQGDVLLLQQLSHDHDCEVQSFTDFRLDGSRVSSTVIRQLLEAGELDSAAASMGRPYSICGRVIRGAGRGRQWGIPTANVDLHRKKLPISGVFSVQLVIKNKPLAFGVANIGRRPTVEGKGQLTLEVHVFNFNESLYGELIQVIFMHKIRDEMTFGSVQALIDQIKQDIVTARGMAPRIEKLT